MHRPKNGGLAETLAIAAVTALVAIGASELQKQTCAPHEKNAGDAPEPIVREPPAVPKGPLNLDSAEEKIRLKVLARGLDQPWSLAFLPNGSILITERAGRVRIIRNGKLMPEPVAGVPIVHTGGARGLQGLMDIALHPRFAENKWVYLAYHRPTAKDGETVLARGTWDGEGLVDMQPIFESGAEDTEASRIAFGRDGLLYMSISAPGSPDVQRSQDLNDYAGKVVRLREDGGIPEDNPFARVQSTKPGIFTFGHRNGHGLAINPVTGEMWETEQGPNGGDEVNVLRPGRNYGWPVVSFGRDYWGHPFASGPTRNDVETPKLVWLPSIGITGMTFYTGDRFRHWNRNLFVTGLREGGIPGTGQIQRIVFNDQWEELRREPLLMELKQRLRDIRQGPDGLLYVLSAEEDGALMRLEPR
jgi:glucose/arabinose dehydrogenase